MEGIQIPVESGTSKRMLLEILRPIIGKPTTIEIKILATMLEDKLYILTRDNRVTIRQKLDIEKLTFNNYLQRLKGKKLLALDPKDNLVKINPMLIKLTSTNSISISLNESA